MVFTQKNNARLFEGWTWSVLGRAIGKKEHAEFDKSLEYIRKGIEILDEKKCRSILSYSYFFLGDIYNDMGRKDEALQYLKKAEAMFQEMGMNYYINKTQEVLERL